MVLYDPQGLRDPRSTVPQQGLWMLWMGTFHCVSHFLASDCPPQGHRNTSSAQPSVDPQQCVLCHHWGKLQILVPFEKNNPTKPAGFKLTSCH